MKYNHKIGDRVQTPHGPGTIRHETKGREKRWGVYHDMRPLQPNGSFFSDNILFYWGSEIVPFEWAIRQDNEGVSNETIH